MSNTRNRSWTGTKDRAVGIHWKPGTYKLKMTMAFPNEQPPARKAVTGTFRTNELTFTVREPGAALDKWVGKGKPLGSSADLFLFAAGLDDESSERLRKQSVGGGVGGFGGIPWQSVEWRVAAAQFATVTVPQDRKLTDEEAKKLIADLKDKAPDVRVRAVRNVSPVAPAEVIAAAVELLADKYEQLGGPFSNGPTFPITHVAADALGRLGATAIEPLIAFAERKGPAATLFHDPPRRAAAAVLGRVGPNAATEKYLRAAIESGDDDRLGPAVVTAMAWGKDGVAMARTILAMPKVSDDVRLAALHAIKLHGDLNTDGPTLRKLLASTEPELQWSAMNALLEFRDTESLPEFERIARDVKAESSSRPTALDCVLSLAGAKTADRLVLDLIARKDDADMRYHALCQAGRRKLTAALPVMLDVLDDPRN